MSLKVLLVTDTVLWHFHVLRKSVERSQIYIHYFLKCLLFNEGDSWRQVCVRGLDSWCGFIVTRKDTFAWTTFVAYKWVTL